MGSLRKLRTNTAKIKSNQWVWGPTASNILFFAGKIPSSSQRNIFVNKNFAIKEL